MNRDVYQYTFQYLLSDLESNYLVHVTDDTETCHDFDLNGIVYFSWFVLNSILC